MMVTYIVAATGGLEEPTFQGFTDPVKARNHFDLWKADLITQPGDRVDLLKVYEDGTVTQIQSQTKDEDNFN